MDDGELAESHAQRVINISVELHNAVVDSQSSDIEACGGIHVHLALDSRAASAGVGAAFFGRVLYQTQVLELYTRLCCARKNLDISVSVNGREYDCFLAEVRYEHGIALFKLAREDIAVILDAHRHHRINRLVYRTESFTHSGACAACKVGGVLRLFLFFF